MAASSIDHGARKHALLSASGASRWLSCPPSARLEEKFQESKPSVYAEEGTLAHEIGDLTLRKYVGAITKKVFDSELKALQKNELYYTGMIEEVEIYTGYVQEAFMAAKQITTDAVLMIEERLDFSHLVEQGFGTGDAGIIADGVLEIIDLKFGKGVKVEAEKNPQLMLYGSGALRQYDMFYDIKTVRLTIVQPRLNHISSWDISVEELRDWGTRIVKPAAALAYEGKGVQKAGDHCRWCKVKAMCATLAAKNVALAKYDFKDPLLLTDDQILEVYGQIPMLQDWANSVAEFILDTALKGKEWAGYKLVEGRSQRRWVSEEDAIKILEEQGYKPIDYLTTKLVGIPAIEKLLGKKEFPVVMGNQVVTPPGKPTVVPESDKRPAMGIEQAKRDFADDLEK